ncbi:uncharacterized protein Dana_GF14717 [Drosophila ananassae]|uniref:Uncharacterized protein n=1 Tax=Drosophila ananassae TaxID=7217 RepID=B3MNL7_DROAN|nr:uncharacterized protein LOC6497537 [Drosophila ananassae]EDV31104.1 uncharacterized protein Dana_GF14717 [Drosophila ananassae]
MTSKAQVDAIRIARQVKKNFPHRNFREISFDREVIRKDILPLSYDEACRLRGPVFEALEDELRRAGCSMLPEFLHCLASKEQALFESLNIRERLSDDMALLYKIVNILADAELAVIVNKHQGLKMCFTGFFDTMQILEPYRQKYGYALNSLNEHIISLCHNIQGQERDAAEPISRIYYAYATYLISSGQRVNAIDYLQIAMNLVRGHVWTAEVGMPAGSLTLHELVAQDLARLLLIQGKAVVRTQPEEAVAMARRATVLIAEIGREKNLEIFIDTFLERANFLMEIGNYNSAQQCLDQIRTQILACTEYRFIKLNIKYYLFQGQCYEVFEVVDKAISSYKRALRLSRLYSHKDLEAQILLYLGKIFAKDTQMTSIAKKCYEHAKRIYVDFNDQHKRKMANYLKAKLMADEITPLYMAMLKASTTRYCAFFNLRQWKNRCRPFWHHLGDEIIKQERDSIYCLLDEEKEDIVRDIDDIELKTYRLEEGDI